MKKGPLLILLFILALVPLGVESSFTLHIFILIYFYIALSVAWNILALSGNVSLGHCAFFGLGAYTSAILFIKLGIVPWIGLIAGIGMALLGALAMSVPLLRLRGPMFSLASIAFGEVLRQVAITWRDLTAGSEGLTIPFEIGWRYLMFPTKTPFYYIFLILAILTTYIAYRIYYSAITCSIMKMVTPRSRIRRMRGSDSSTSTGLSPARTSSSRSSLGRVAKARVISRRLRWA